jgi:phosphoglycerate dehydrogenase-like enzyme
LGLTKLQGAQGLPLQRVVGVLGGGQLGRMMGYAAHRLGVRLVVLDPEGTESPRWKSDWRRYKRAFK